MEEDFVFREAKHSDLHNLLGLLHQLSPPKDAEKSPGSDGLLQVLGKIISDENHFIFVLEKEGRLVGTATLLLQMNLSHAGRPYAHIENVVIDEKHRGKGVGKKILGHLVEKAKERNCYKIILHCKKDKGMPFYKKCGLRETGEMEMRFDL